MTQDSTPRSRIGTALIVSSGNFLEMFDFMVYGYYVAAIARAYFPSDDQFASTMAALSAFGAGFLMRPLGALLIGPWIDRYGRRSGLLATLGLMAVGTLTIALMPDYARIGASASLFVLIGRLLQGLSAGVEVGAVSVYLSEIAPSGRKGFYVSWQSASQQVAVAFAAALGLAANAALTPEQMSDWGWRIPFVLGCLLIPLLFVIRRNLAETPEFLARVQPLRLNAIVASLASNWGLIALGTMMAVMTTVAFYLITAYTPTFAATELHLSARASYGVTLCVGVSNFALLLTMGRLADRIGRLPLMTIAAIAALLTSYPAMLWLVGAPSFGRLLAVELWLSLVYAAYNGAMIVFLTEIIPSQVRTSGFSLAYSLATAVFGGFTPAICTYLIHVTGNKAMPGVWLSAAAACGLAGAVLTARRSGRPVRAVAELNAFASTHEPAPPRQIGDRLSG